MAENALEEPVAANIASLADGDARIALKALLRAAQLTEPSSPVIRSEAVKQSKLDKAAIEEFCRRAAFNLKAFTFEDKRLVLEALQVKVMIDGEKAVLTGALPLGQAQIMFPSSQSGEHNRGRVLPFAVSLGQLKDREHRTDSIAV